ncbi:N-acetylglucosamine-6-phosphate deacetylase [Microbacterium album]|uniref:N-acetylglucosamine-6-phosphate deacetylase n=1 Tax=Microbacterium album TaxID=2053191 RepID=A0A917MKU8_9MICO|nr:amidohydrolase family protein [Microbacterium album]GGH36853.1 N-acetylglucosamine-6-phosphate deacetylase [Microbacterium album]
MAVVLHSARVVQPGATRAEAGSADAWVRFDRGRVEATGRGGSWRASMRAGDDDIDLAQVAGPGALLCPGFIDLHRHGGAGAAHEDGPEAVLRAHALHRAHGTTRAVVSLVTAELDLLAQRVAQIGELTRAEPGILGSHLEGPFLAPPRRGAHDAALLRDPAPATVERLLRAGIVDGRGTVRQVTLAPELPGGLDAIRRIVAHGAIAAIGHTDADAAETRRAIAAGATLLTHAFNAMPGIHHRRPGPIPVAAADPRVTLELIADGAHVDDVVVRMLFAAAPGRVALVTDAMAGTGMPDGPYRVGGLVADVAAGVATVRGTDALAGSTLTQDAALRRAVASGVTLGDAVAALTSTPARALGRPDLGALRAGGPADAVVLDERLEVRAVWVAGRAL